MGNVAYYLLIFSFYCFLKTTCGHNDDVVELEDEKTKQMEQELMDRNLLRREWKSDEISSRQVAHDRSEEATVKRTTKRTTTSTTARSEGPPLDPRYRRIFNPDETASALDHPYIAALLAADQLWCGAVLIAHDRAVTAAHCLQLQFKNRLFREYIKMLSVRVGSSNTTSGGRLVGVSKITFHPNYDPSTLQHNVAVLTLEPSAAERQKDEDDIVQVEEIKYLRDRVVPSDTNITFLGWGAVLAPTGKGGTTLLQKVTLPVYDHPDCQEMYGKELVGANNFCAGYITLAKNVCNHDAGGPALLDGKLVGILSFSAKRCDLPDKPAVFTNLGSYADWLDTAGEKPKPTDTNQ